MIIVLNKEHLPDADWYKVRMLEQKSRYFAAGMPKGMYLYLLRKHDPGVFNRVERNDIHLWWALKIVNEEWLRTFTLILNGEIDGRNYE